MARSLQGRLLLLVLGLVAGVWLATATLTWIDVRHELDELLDSHLAQAAALLVVQQAAEMEDEHRGVDAPTLHRYASRWRSRCSTTAGSHSALRMRQPSRCSSSRGARPTDSRRCRSTVPHGACSPLMDASGTCRSSWASRSTHGTRSCGRCCEVRWARCCWRCLFWPWRPGGQYVRAWHRCASSGVCWRSEARKPWIRSN